MTSKFKVGDWVFYPKYGWGKIAPPDPFRGEYRILVYFVSNKGEEVTEDFTKDGRFCSDHIGPSLFTEEESKILNFPPRPKKKVTKEVVRWAVIFPDGNMADIFHTENKAKEWTTERYPPTAQVVKLTGTIETEE